jgi:hypothetical protein
MVSAVAFTESIPRSKPTSNEETTGMGPCVLLLHAVCSHVELEKGKSPSKLAERMNINRSLCFSLVVGFVDVNC